MRPLPPGGGRRELPVTCPSCGARSSVPFAAVGRNNYFCSGCGKSLDLQAMIRASAPAGDGTAAAASLPPPRRDRGGRNYKSARKGRR